MWNQKNADAAKAWLKYIDNDPWFQQALDYTKQEQSIFDNFDYKKMLNLLQGLVKDKLNTRKTEIVLEPLRTEECLKKNKIYNPVVWNFADFHSVGGWFLRGSRAQEESLCHVSGLYRAEEAMSQKYYIPHKGISNYGMWYHTAMFHDYVPFEIKGDRFKAHVLTVPAPNYTYYVRYKKGDKELKAKLDKAFRERFEIAFLLGASSGAYAVIGGAWGCGAFKGDPTMCANLWLEMVKKYPGLYSHVFLPVPSGKNYDVFKSIIG